MPKTKKRIDHCENPTISEAWIALEGNPATYESTESKAIEHLAKSSINGIQQIPTMIVSDNFVKDGAFLPPFWQSQFRYKKDNEKVVRFGHRYFSLHTIVPSGSQYRGYNNEFDEDLLIWSNLLSKVISKKQNAGVSFASFGYTNKFYFEYEKAFNMSDHFNLSIGIYLGLERQNLERFRSSFDLAVTPSLSINAQLEGISVPAKKGVIVTTKIIAKQNSVSKCDFSSIKDSIKLITELKELAKGTFFSFATDKTHKLMRVRYV